MSKASVIMTPNPLFLASGMDLDEAAEFFLKYGITSAPVQNPLGEILGHMTEFDIVKALVHSRARPEMKKVAHAEEFFEPATFVEDIDDIATVVRQMIKSPVHRVLVRNGVGVMIGIISPKDLLKSIHGGDKTGKVVADEVKALQLELMQLRSRVTEMSSYLQTYDTVFQSGLFGLHSADKTGRISFANERLHMMLGYNPGELIGKSIFDLYAQPYHEEARMGLKKIIADGRQSASRSVMLKKGAEEFPVDIASAGLKDELGRIIGTFTISRKQGEAIGSVGTEAIFGSP
jgi:PAS domain S-box-containing protein